MSETGDNRWAGCITNPATVAATLSQDACQTVEVLLECFFRECAQIFFFGRAITVADSFDHLFLAHSPCSLRIIAVFLDQQICLVLVLELVPQK